MTDPFRISGPASISFSGGRTSAYMLHEIVRAWGGTLPDNVHVCFANTGKEREETLRFVHECQTRWNVRVHWIEWRDNSDGFEEVGFNSASRKGEPFTALVAKKQMPPNWKARFCTEFLKVKAMTAFARSIGLHPGEYADVIGLRADEEPRLWSGRERAEKDGRDIRYPLATAKITEPDVLGFWSRQPFDLGLHPGQGNCDLCFLKSQKTRAALMREWPGSAGWWIEQERVTSGFFDRRIQYAAMEAGVRAQGDLFGGFLSDVDDGACGEVCVSEFEPA